MSALLHTTGTATFTDDLARQAGELAAWPVLATRAHALIERVDASAATALAGVHAFVSHADVPGAANRWGKTHDEEFFASREVLFYGQIIGLVVAETPALAKHAAHLVQVEYAEVGGKPLLTIDDAIEANSFYEYTHEIVRGEFSESLFDKEQNVVIVEINSNIVISQEKITYSTKIIH